VSSSQGQSEKVPFMTVYYTSWYSTGMFLHSILAYLCTELEMLCCRLKERRWANGAFIVDFSLKKSQESRKRKVLTIAMD